MAGALMLAAAMHATAAAQTAAPNSTRACLDLPATARNDAEVPIKLLRTAPPAGADEVLFVHIWQQGKPSPRYVRPLNPATGTSFKFGEHDKTYMVRLARGTSMWPVADDDGTPFEECAAQSVVTSETEPGIFSGARGHGWFGVRLPVRAEAGASAFVKRLGVAAAVQVVPWKRDVNQWVGSFDVRWRGARGYLGGGVRYFPDEEVDRFKWRPALTAAEELPGWRGKPIWFILDARLDRSKGEAKFWRMLGYSFGVRIDLTGNRP
jgi:hypothetical protein